MLSNPETRKTYDNFGEQGIKDGGGGSGGGGGCCCSSPTEFFDMFFRGGFGGGQRRPRRTKDLIRVIQVSLAWGTQSKSMNKHPNKLFTYGVKS